MKSLLRGSCYNFDVSMKPSKEWVDAILPEYAILDCERTKS